LQQNDPGVDVLLSHEGKLPTSQLVLSHGLRMHLTLPTLSHPFLDTPFQNETTTSRIATHHFHCKVFRCSLSCTNFYMRLFGCRVFAPVHVPQEPLHPSLPHDFSLQFGNVITCWPVCVVASFLPQCMCHRSLRTRCRHTVSRYKLGVHEPSQSLTGCCTFCHSNVTGTFNHHRRSFSRRIWCA